jgi:hypothetical protein
MMPEAAQDSNQAAIQAQTNRVEGQDEQVWPFFSYKIDILQILVKNRRCPKSQFVQSNCGLFESKVDFWGKGLRAQWFEP